LPKIEDLAPKALKTMENDMAIQKKIKPLRREEIEYLQVVPRGQFINKEKLYIKDKMRELFPKLIGK
jgi:hypothetical protein